MTAAVVVLATTLLTAEQMSFYLPKSLVELFQACEYRHPDGASSGELFRYRLFAPHAPKPAERYPLLVWLHGAGESGSDNRRSLRWMDMILEDPRHPEKYPFFILVVQFPSARNDRSAPRGDSQAAKPDDMLDVTFAVLQKTLREQPIDPDRVYLSGVSSGGTACWNLALRHPEAFAAVMPLGAGGGDPLQAARLARLSIWAFHNRLDNITPTRGDEEMVAAVQKAGGNAFLTIVDSSGHDCWQTAFLRYGAMAWMLDQRRGAWLRWTPAGCRSWRWWHVFAVPLAFLALVVLGWHGEQRRRQKQRAAANRDSTQEPVFTNST